MAAGVAPILDPDPDAEPEPEPDVAIAKVGVICGPRGAKGSLEGAMRDIEAMEPRREVDETVAEDRLDTDAEADDAWAVCVGDI